MTTASNSEMMNFFHALVAGGNGLLEFRPLKPASYAPAGRAYLNLSCLNGELTDFLHEHKLNHNFFGMALRRDNSSGALKNCSTLSVLYADIDFKHTPEAKARRLLAECPLPPSIIVHSGNGLHCYWLLREPLDLQDQKDCDKAYSLLRRLCTFLHADPIVAEPAHILRVPGTLNYKYDPPRLVQIELMEAERRYNASEFEVLPEPNAKTANGGFVAPEKIPAGERNSWLYRLGRSLKAKGLSPEAIRAALQAENRAKCEPPCDDAGMERVIESVLTQADRPEFRSLEERLVALRALPPVELSATWHTNLDGLNAVDRQTVLKEVARLMSVGINTLKLRLKEDKAQHKHAETVGRVGTRLVIRYRPEDVSAMAQQAEQATLARATEFELINYCGELTRVSFEALPHAHRADSDDPPPPTVQLDLMNRAKLLPLVERAVVFQVPTDRGWIPIQVPEKVLDQFLVNPHAVPKVSGLSTHPLVTPSGRIISASGIDQPTGLLLYGSEMKGLRPYTKAEARTAIAELRAQFLEGFEFPDALNETSALAMLLSGVERKVLPACPGYMIVAAQQSVGKTTLGRRCHLQLTGLDMPVLSWPQDNEVEVKKLALAVLLRNPEMIIFDNIGDGLTYKSPIVAALITSSILEDRLLGHSRIARASTSTLILLTGNNISLSGDEAHRFVPVRLTTKSVSPHTRTFSHPDVVRHGLEIRETVLRHVVGIVAGYRRDTERISPLSRFPEWDALVRQPLIWAGMADVGTVFDANLQASPELGAHLALMIELQKHFPGGEEFSASTLVRNYLPAEPYSCLSEALLALRVKDLKSERSVGHALSKVCGRNAVITENGHEVVLFLERSTKDGLSRYRVMTRGSEGGSW